MADGATDYRRLGYVAVALAGFLWGVGGTFARTVLDRGASAVELTEARAWITTLGIGLFLLIRQRSIPRDALRRPAVILAVVVFGLVLATANFTYYVAIAALPVAIAIVIQYTAPAIVVVWKGLVDRRPPSRRVLGALALAIVGVFLISEAYQVFVAGSGDLPTAGVVVAIVSAFGFAAVLLFGEFLSETLGSSPSVFGGFLVSSVFWAVLQIFRGRPDTLLNPDFWPAILFLGVVTTIAPFSLFVWGLGKIGAPASGITTTIEPVSGAVLAYIWLGQALTGFQIAGAVAVIVGIALLQLERAEDVGSWEIGLTPETAEFESSGDKEDVPGRPNPLI